MMRKFFTVCIFLCFFKILIAQEDTTSWKVEFLSVNSLSDDFSPAFFRGGLLFTSNRNADFGIKRVDENGEPFTNLYLADFISHVYPVNPSPYYVNFRKTITSDYTSQSSNDSKTLVPNVLEKSYDKLAKLSKDTSFVRLAGPFLQTKYHDGPAFFSFISNDIYLTRTNYYKRSTKKEINKKNNLQIYVIKNLGGQNYYLRKFEHNSNDYSTMHPSLSLDGKLMIFASDKPGGFGGTDLYYSIKIGSSWSVPVNMGEQINTTENEVFPFLSNEGNLYFSSDRPESMGKLDVFFVKLNGIEALSKPIRLPNPINTEFDDFGFIISDKIGYMTSDRLGSDDIYRVIKK